MSEVVIITIILGLIMNSNNLFKCLTPAVKHQLQSWWNSIILLHQSLYILPEAIIIMLLSRFILVKAIRQEVKLFIIVIELYLLFIVGTHIFHDKQPKFFHLCIEFYLSSKLWRISSSYYTQQNVHFIIISILAYQKIQYNTRDNLQYK